MIIIAVNVGTGATRSAINSITHIHVYTTYICNVVFSELEASCQKLGRTKLGFEIDKINNNRKQFARYVNCKSHLKCVPCGVPQGCYMIIYKEVFSYREKIYA